MFMKSKNIFYVIVLLFSVSSVFGQKTSESVEIPKEWNFKTGDNPEFSNPDFVDQDWKTIKADNYWETQGYSGYDGIAWYRAKVIIPSSLKKNNTVLQTIRISLGQIDDGDETYLNGMKIGETIGWSTQRTYLVPFDLIEWDKENTISIRVNDMGGNGGMHGGIYSISNVKLSDIAFLKSYDKPSEFKSSESTFEKNLIFNFNVPIEKIEGVIHVKIYDAVSKAIVFKKEDHVVIGNKADSTYKISIKIKEPATYKIDYTFTSIDLDDTLKYSTLFSYKPTPRGNEHPEYPLINQTVTGKAMPFDLKNIQFGGYLQERLNANLTQRLLNIDETGILECYYNRPGKQTWVGEYTGKYLHAASRVWRSTQNAQLKVQMDRIVDILIGCQNEDGYLGTYSPSDYWTDWDVWAHKYNILGLMSYYATTGYKPAFETSIRMGDLLCRTFGENEGQRNIIFSSGHVGMASTSVLEPMTLLYQYTGDKKYLDFCKYIIKAYNFENGPKIITTLTTIKKVDKTANAKAYEMMSNLTGIVKLYQLTSDEKLLKAAEIAWNDIAKNKLYITGTASRGELFQEDFDLPAGNDVYMGEGCVTTTWLQFSQALYYLTGETKYMDEIEKSIYNHLLAAENPETGCVSYYTALQGKKPYRCTIDGHCCLASIPRGIAAIPELALTKNSDNGFNINIYSSEKLKDKVITKNGKEVAVDCTIDSKFPEEGSVTITLTPETKVAFLLALRVPSWCSNFKANVDGKNYDGVPGNYLNIDQMWNKNSIIKVSFNLNEQILDGGKSYSGYIALKIGPQVLAVDQSLNPEIIDLDKLSFDSPKLSTASKALLPKSWIGSQIYTSKAFYDGKPIDLKLVPYADAGQKEGDIRVWIKKK
jgi:DUF1680 family protein